MLPVSASPEPDRLPPPGGLPVRAFRVLVVDDEPAIHADIRKVLSPVVPDPQYVATEAALFGLPAPGPALNATFLIDSAFQGLEAIQMTERAVAEGRPYALAFVDMRMPPGLDGLETILGLWKADPGLQLVSCSAYSDHSWEEMITVIGETDRLVILRKPFDPIEIVQLAHTLSKKWDLHRTLRRQIETLEAAVAERTRDIQKRQAVFQLILENVTDLIAVVDATGRRIYNSPSYETVLGFTPQELQHTDAFAQIHPDDLGAVQAAVERARHTGRGEMLVYRMKHRDGSWRTLESCAGVVRDPEGDVAYFVVVARDITQRHAFEIKQQLGQKLESIGRLAAGIAHEINTPTQYITDNTRFLAASFQKITGVLRQYRDAREQLATRSETAELARALAAAETAVELDFLLTEIPQAVQQNLEGLVRVARIVQSMKEFSHPNSPDMDPSDLNRAIETAITVSRHEWKYVADIVTEFDPNLPPVPCVLDELNQVVLNLLVNAAHTIADALKARNEPRGRITVRTRQDAGWAVIEIADTGMGIAPEHRSRIFEPFFTTKEVGKGTGQGLAVVHAVVVKHHRGAVDFTSEVGRGSTFLIKLPLVVERPGN